MRSVLAILCRGGHWKIWSPGGVPVHTTMSSSACYASRTGETGPRSRPNSSSPNCPADLKDLSARRTTHDSTMADHAQGRSRKTCLPFRLRAASLGKVSRKKFGRLRLAPKTGLSAELLDVCAASRCQARDQARDGFFTQRLPRLTVGKEEGARRYSRLVQDEDT